MLLLELPFLEALGRTTTSWGWLELLMGILVTIGPEERWRELVERDDFLSFSGVELLLEEEQSVCFEDPHFAQGKAPML